MNRDQKEIAKETVEFVLSLRPEEQIGWSVFIKDPNYLAAVGQSSKELCLAFIKANSVVKDCRTKLGAKFKTSKHVRRAKKLITRWGGAKLG